MPSRRMRTAVDRSIRSAVSDGRLDLDAHAAPIAMLRYMADFLDRAGDGTPAMRYATPASFLSYCEALGLTPPGDTPAKPDKKPEDGGLGQMRGKFKAYRGGMSA